jgi:5-methylthioribose kinase
VTLDAKFHFKTDALEPVHGFYGPMAFLAGDFLSYMPLVVEKDVFR